MSGDTFVLVLHLVRTVVFLLATLGAVGIFFLFMRRRTNGERSEDRPADTDRLWQAMDRMELRLETLERLLTDGRRPADADEHIFAPVEDDRLSGRQE